MSTPKAKRFAQIVADSVSVLCPYCGEPQPNPDNGADTWKPSEVRTYQGRRECVSCDEPFHLVPQSKAQVAP